MSKDVTLLTAALDRFSDAWKANDGAAIASHFTEDGSLINPFGERANGRAAVSAMYSEYFKGMLAGTSTAFNIGTVRSVESGHAFVDAEQTIFAPDGSVVLAVHIAALFRREGEAWRFADARPYAYSQPST